VTAPLAAVAVIDLGFGDGGKGLVVDFLARDMGAGVVVRFNGGAQAGHNVVAPDGRHHTFAQLGAASFLPQVRTFLSRRVLVHPTALAHEARVLASRGVADPLARVRVSERARVITPFHQAANRMREVARGHARHGSCGVGVGETVDHAARHPDEAIVAGDWRAPRQLVRALRRIRERLRAELVDLPRDTPLSAREWVVFERPDVIDQWVSQVAPLADLVVPDSALADWLRGGGAVLFEGAQGMLLDESIGFHPFCTWSDCTARGARELLAEAAPGAELRVWGVLRAHAMRHGAGPLPTETAEVRPLCDHNGENAWQGSVRYGWFDAVLARYALALAGELEALVLTHVDLAATRTAWPLCTAYGVSGARDPDLLDDRGQLVALPAPPPARQARMAELLARCVPGLADAPGQESGLVAAIETLLERRVDVVSRGPRASDVARRRASG
jgi:adenylosuccinate synthase